MAWGVASAVACSESNQAACERFVDEANANYRACGYEHLLLDQPPEPGEPAQPPTCPASLDTGGVDCTERYRCLREASVCCTPEHQATEDPDCELGTIDFAAMDACQGCS
jgi:hypothetical protein